MPTTSYGVDGLRGRSEQLRREAGSGDAELAARYGASFTADDNETQGLIDDHMPDASGTLTLADVARQVIIGEPYDERVGFAYGYFLKWLCARHGASQWNGSLMPIPLDYLSMLDAEFEKAGLLTPEISIHELGWGGAPVPVPMGDVC